VTERNWRGRVFIGVSLDGYIARDDGDIDWLTDPPQNRTHRPGNDDRPAQTWETFFPAVDHLVMGRGTYEKVLSFDEWPYSRKRTIVLSNTLATTDPRITIARSVEAVCELLAARSAQQVYVDGGRVIQSFLRADLLDELTVCVAPVLLGDGQRLFGDLDADIWLELVASHIGDGGMVHTTYRVHR